MECSVFASLGRTVGPAGPFFPSCLPGTLLNTATYAQALSHVASLKGKICWAGGRVRRVGMVERAETVWPPRCLRSYQLQPGSQSPSTSTLEVLFDFEQPENVGEC